MRRRLQALSTAGLVATYQYATIGRGAVNYYKLTPLGFQVLKIGPGWPGRPGIGTVTAVAEIVILMWAFQFWRGIAKKRREKRMRGSLYFLVPLAIVYLVLLTFYTYPHPQLGRHDVG